MWHTPYPYLNDPTRPELAQPEVIVIVVIAGLAMLMLLYALGIHWDCGSKLRPGATTGKRPGRPTSVPHQFGRAWWVPTNINQEETRRPLREVNRPTEPGRGRPEEAAAADLKGGKDP
jgi:hypothetical protein